MNTKMKPSDQWADRKDRLLSEIEKALAELSAIDKATPWSEAEPKWWLEMSNVQRDLYALKERLETGSL